MFGSQVLEVAIGIVFIFVLVSIICTAVREGLDAWMKTRAAYLHHSIRELLQDKTENGIVTQLFRHPMVYGLFSGEYKGGASTSRPGAFTTGGNLPSYIPSKNFALALMDLAARGPQTEAAAATATASVVTLDSIRANIGTLGNPQVQRALLTAIDSAQGDLDKAIKNVENWYDSAMDRASGWYRRSTQWVLFWIGLFIAVVLNVNAISIVHYLSHNDKARAAIVEQAGKAAADPASKNTEQAKADLEALRLPIGWSEGWGAPRKTTDSRDVWNFWLGPVLGWLITALAATLGAPFWFDVLNKVMVIRSTVKPHEKSPEEGSEDRQAPSRRKAPVDEIPPPAAGAAAGTALTIMPAAQPQIAPDPPDRESAVDACDVDLQANVTADDELPAAKGGVA